MKSLLTLVLAFSLVGCAKSDNPSTTPQPQAPGSLAKDAINGMTGKTAVDQGQKAKEKIKAISSDEKKQLNEVLDGK